MASISFLGIFLFITATVGKQCSRLRNVEVVLELPTYSQGVDTFVTHIAVQNFIRDLHGDNNPKGGCWKANTRVIDSEIIPVQKDGMWKQNRGSNTPEENTNQLINIIVQETEFSYDSPKKLIVLVLSDTPRNLELLEENTRILLELNCVFIVVSVGSSDLDERQKRHFRRIAKADARVFSIDKFQQLKKTGVYFDKLMTLFHDPFRKFARDSQLFGPIGRSRLVTQGYDKCHHPIDVGFVMDKNSESLKYDYWEEKRFVLGLAEAFGISRDGTHASVIEFNHKAKLSIKLNQFTSADAFNQAVRALQPGKSLTRIDLALEMARDDLFSVENGGRAHKMKILILITRGKQTKEYGYTRPETIAEQIRRQGVIILVIGVGDGVDETELSAISGPDDNWRKVKDFEELSSKAFVEKMTRKTCDLAAGRECSVIVDICFLIDASGSIDEKTDFEKMKEFVIRLANTFELSEAGAHGSLVVFSDYISEEENQVFSKVTVYLKENKTPTQFRHAVEQSGYVGYRTRIDLGFQLAEKDVFNVQHGSRPNVNKVIILLTDGNQYPDKPEYDPVQASQNLYEQGVSIYAIGIGRTVDRRRLEAITRSKDRVFFAFNFEALESQKFVRHVSTTACVNVTRPTPLTRTPPPGPITTPCTPPCTTPCPTPCSGGCPVFNNIFNLNLGPTYILNGVQVGKDSGGGLTLHGQCVAQKCKTYPMNSMNVGELMKVIRTAVEEMCKGKCKQAESYVNKQGRPAVVNNRININARRKRRSVDTTEGDAEDAEKLRVMIKLSKVAGCNMFIQALQKYGIFENITKLMKTSKHVSIFCPIDDAYEKIYEKTELADNEKNILLNHIGLKHDKFGTMYRTLSGGKILFNAVGKEKGRTTWKANGADVIVSLTDGINSEIIITSDVIHPVTQGVLEVLKKNADVSIFYNMLVKSEMKNVFMTNAIEKICFTTDVCVSLTSSMVSHLKDAVNFKQFTVIAPTNAMFKKMSASKLKTLVKNTEALTAFLQEHVFLGSIGTSDSHHDEIGTSDSHPSEIASSLSPQHLLITTRKREGGMMLTDSNGREFEIKSSIRVNEGLLHIVDTPV